MGRKCWVEGCLSDSRRREDQGVTFHKVPNQLDIRRRWFQLCRISPERSSQKAVCVCSRHFMRADFGTYRGKKYVLKHNVEPSVFPWDKSRLAAIKRAEEIIARRASQPPPPLIALKRTEQAQKQAPPTCKNGSNNGSSSGTSSSDDQPLVMVRRSRNKHQLPEKSKKSQVEQPKLIKPKQEPPGEIPEVPIVDVKPFIEQESASPKEELIEPDVKPTEDTSKVDVSSGVEEQEQQQKEQQQPQKEQQEKQQLDKGPLVLVASQARSHHRKKSGAVSKDRKRPRRHIGHGKKVSKAASNSSPKRCYDSNGRMLFEMNQRIEALDFNNVWYSARIIEEDYEENEVLVHFETYSNKYDEWISMDSPRLRPWRGGRKKPMQPQEKLKRRCSGVVEQYEVGERCTAFWRDMHLFPATVTKVLPNDTYEVVFDDGFVKNLKEHKLCKLDATPQESSPLFDPVRSTKEERREKKRKFSTNFAEMFGKKSPRLADPQSFTSAAQIAEDSSSETTANLLDSSAMSASPKGGDGTSVASTSYTSGGGTDHQLSMSVSDEPADDDCYTENDDDVDDNDDDDNDDDNNKTIFEPWVPKWVNGVPVGREATMVSSEGVRKSVIVDDPRLPRGWVKHLAMRSSGVSAGKWDTVIISPDGKRLRSRAEVKQYLRNTGAMTYNWSRFDFAIHRVRTKTDVEPKSRKQQNANKSPRSYHRHQIVGAKQLTVELEKLPMDKINTNHETNTTITEDGIEGGALKIEQVADGYQCPIEGCRKIFRKENLTQMHVKHYHPEYTKLLGCTPNVADLAYRRTMVAEIPEIDTGSDTQSSPLTTHVNHHSINSHNSGNQLTAVTDHQHHRRRSKDSEIIRLLSTSSAASNQQTPERRSFGGSGIKTLLPIVRRKSTDRRKSVEFSPTISASRSPVDLVAAISQQQQQQNVIIEGGQVIKIVRMKQEEIINCTCGITEEDGLMIQCDLCLCWQHAFCNNIAHESDVPDKYVCYICQNPVRERTSMRYKHDQDWLKHGVLPIGTTYHSRSDGIYARRFATLKKSHDVSGGLVELADYVNTLRQKLKIAESKDHPKLYLWSKMWDKTSQSFDERKPDETTGAPLLMSILKAGQNSNSSATTGDVDEPPEGPKIPVPEAAIDSADCRLNLLEHILDSQKSVEQRLDVFEKQLEDMEWDAFEANDENAPRTRQTLRMLMNDLKTLQEMSQLSNF